MGEETAGDVRGYIYLLSGVDIFLSSGVDMYLLSRVDIFLSSAQDQIDRGYIEMDIFRFG